MSVYSDFRQAIAQKKQVLCTYHGRHREVCPHVIGLKRGREKVLNFQFGGESNSGPLPPGGEWRCMNIDEITSVVLRDGPWHTGPSHTQAQTCVDQIDLEVIY